MNFSLFSSMYERLEAKYIALLVTIIVLTLSNAFLVQNLIDTSNRRTTIVVPSHLNSRVEVGKEYASPEYIRVMAFHITGLLYSFTPYTVSRQFNEVLSYVPLKKGTEERAELIQTLQKKTDQIVKLKISESFLPDDLVFVASDRCVVSGKLIRWSVNTEVAEEQIYIEYTYQINGGGFQIEKVRVLDHAQYAALRRSNGAD